MKTILVTGAGGYIGSVLTRLLLKQNRVIAVDNLLKGDYAIKELYDNDNFKLHKVDIIDYLRLENVFESVFESEDIDVVVNLAGIVGDPACKKYPDLANKTNYEGAFHLCKLVEEYKVRKFIQASTCSVYGYQEDIITENTKLNPLSLYASTKMDAEKVILRHNINSVILRFATAFGLSYSPRFDLTVNEFAKELALSRELVVYARDSWRPYCHVNDLSSAILRVIEKDIPSGTILNVGSNSNNFTKKMIVDNIKRYIIGANVQYVDKAGDDKRNYKVDFSKINKGIKFAIRYSVDYGIREIIKAIKLSDRSFNPDDVKYRSDNFVI